MGKRPVMVEIVVCPNYSEGCVDETQCSRVGGGGLHLDFGEALSMYNPYSAQLRDRSMQGIWKTIGAYANHPRSELAWEALGRFLLLSGSILASHLRKHQFCQPELVRYARRWDHAAGLT